MSSSLGDGDDKGSRATRSRNQPIVEVFEDSDYTLSAADVLRVFYLLSRILNVDIALQILESMPELYRQHSENFDISPFELTPTPTTTAVVLQNNQAIARTPPLRISRKGPHHSIRRITFEIIGKPQSLAEDPATWTWYEAAVVSTSKSLADVDDHNDLADAAATGATERNKSVVTRRTSELARDARGATRYQKTVIRISSEPRFGDQKLLESIRSGDVIEIRVCALMPAWSNFVERASITVETSGVSGILK